MKLSPDEAAAILREHNQRRGNDNDLTDEQVDAVYDAFVADLRAKDRTYRQTLDAIDNAKRR